MKEKAKAIQFSGVTKTFPGVKALDNVSFSVNEGEIHAIVGENGAGKSTLLNILHGIYTEYEGNVKINNQIVDFKDARNAISEGIVKVHQEVSMIPELSVGQNIALGYEPTNNFFVNYKKIHEEVNEILKRLNINFKSEDLANNLNIGEMQMASIAKALYHNADVISFDEPTASLSNKEIKSLFKIITDLKKQGITIIYISHHLDEIFEICDTVTVLRDGKSIDSSETTNINKENLVKKMVGRNVNKFAFSQSSSIKKEKILEVKNLQVDGVFDDISFELHKGEILGFAGLVGSKRTEIMLTLFGALEKDNGDIILNGEKVDIKTPQQAVNKGIGLVPENRKTQGFAANFNNAMNVALSRLDKFLNKIFINYKKANENTKEIGEKINLRPNDPEYMTVNLSGGNQQKVVISKWLSADVDVLILDEPTKGVDVGAKTEIYEILNQLVKEGKSIIIVSSELPEVLGVADRIIIMREGKKVKEMKNENLTEEDIIGHVMGV